MDQDVELTNFNIALTESKCMLNQWRKSLSSRTAFGQSDEFDFLVEHINNVIPFDILSLQTSYSALRQDHIPTPPTPSNNTYTKQNVKYLFPTPCSQTSHEGTSPSQAKQPRRLHARAFRICGLCGVAGQVSLYRIRQARSTAL